MTTWGKICRICSSPADYEIFAKIPTYLHASNNDFLVWQSPINVLIEETTGLKVSQNDGLPNTICALCISYLKHAVNFRDQTIKNCLSLIAVEHLRQQAKKNLISTKDDDKVKHKDKESELITAQELSYSEDRNVDTNLLMNNNQQEHDKVCKQLLNINNFGSTAMQQNVEQQMRYLNLLFDRNVNVGQRTKHRNAAASNAEAAPESSGSKHYTADKYQMTTSSDEHDQADTTVVNNHNIFSYDETNFQEDDIMDTKELRDAITITIPESCKERKCRACLRRFMFEESYNEHMSTCIEYRFLTFIEEVDKLLDIRRNRAISPHEFIRRMIFCLRKTSIWLKTNYSDMLLPELIKSTDNGAKERLESEGKSSATSSGEQQKILTSNEKLVKVIETFKRKNSADLHLGDKNNTSNTVTYKNDKNCNEKSRLSETPPSLFKKNVLHEIERSQLQKTSVPNNANASTNTPQLKKPIAVLANSVNGAHTNKLNFAMGGANNEHDRLTFLEKLHKAAAENCATSQPPLATPTTPKISVRKDLQTPLKELPKTPQLPNMKYSARCNPCNLNFEILANLEVHNAMHHNNVAKVPQQQPTPQLRMALVTDMEAEAERSRIISLFEDVDLF